MKKVISLKNLPTRLPIIAMIVFYLLLDKLKAPGFVWGIVGTIYGLAFIVGLIGIFRAKQVDIFEEEED